MATVPQEIVDAFNHIQEKFPQVTQVFFGTDNRWLYCDEDFNAPDFDGGIDTGMLEDAADAVPFLPYAYAPQ